MWNNVVKNSERLNECNQTDRLPFSKKGTAAASMQRDWAHDRDVRGRPCGDLGPIEVKVNSAHALKHLYFHDHTLGGKLGPV